MNNLKIFLIVLTFFPSLSFSQNPFRLLDEYNFLQREGKIFKLYQSQDTLYEVRKSIYSPDFTDPRKHYKIHGFLEIPNYHLLKLESLDTIPLTTDPYPLNRYLVIAIKDMDEKQLGYLPIAGSLSRSQLDSFSISRDSLTQKFFYTHYSNKYMKTFTSLKEITSEKEANKVVKLMKSKRYKEIINSWKATKAGDIWGTGLTAEILNKACLKAGYNPILADQKISEMATKL